MFLHIVVIFVSISLQPLSGPQSKDKLGAEDLHGLVITDAVTLTPVTFKGKPCLRFELFGCECMYFCKVSL